MYVKLLSTLKFKGNKNLEQNNVQESSSTPKPAFEKVMKDFEKFEKQSKKTYPILRNSNTFSYFLIPALATAFGGFLKIRKLAKESLKSGDNKVLNTYKTKYLTQVGLLVGGAVAATGITVQALKKKINNSQKNSQKLIDNFNKENNSDMKFQLLPATTMITAAMTDPISGSLSMSEQFWCDPILSNIHQKYFIKHELVHAKQYIEMARLDNGIKKINFLAVQKLALSLNSFGKNEVEKIYKEIESGLPDKYNNAELDRFGYKIKVVDYITAIHKVLNDKNCTEDDLPIIINKEYYEKAISTKGPLTKEEREKAQIYLDAYEKYPPNVGFLQVINPKSKYRTNILEKEAYKMNPWYTM